MRKTSRILLYTVLFILIVSCSSGATPEWRALYVDGWHTGMWTAAEIDAMLATAHTAGYNIIIPVVRQKGDALYSSTYGGPDGTGEPKPVQVQPPGFDPLEHMIQQAHALGMQVHPCMCTHRVATQTDDWFYTSHQDWLTKDQSGALISSEGYWLDPGVPDGEDYTVNVILDLVRNYDIDGIQWDSIRYAQRNSGYNTTAVNRFILEYGYYPTYTDSAFSDWRRKQLNDFVARIYAQVMEIKPWVAVTANTFANYTDAYTNRFQDWDAWMAGHWLDVNAPANHTSNNTTFTNQLDDALDRRHGRYVFSGISIGMNTSANTVEQKLICRQHNGSHGVPWGNQQYSYYYGTVIVPGWFSYVLANLYTDVVPVPTMPWKTSPVNGIVFGQVTDPAHPNDPIYHDSLYNATVTLSHVGQPSVIRTTTTDQTGYFVFTDVEPGAQYTISCSKAGYMTRAYTNQRVLAGQTVREDFELGYTTCTSPPEVTQGAWGLISLPLEPANPDPAVVFNGIDINYHLYRWDNPTQSLKPYDSWDAANFGSVSTADGYWLETPTDPAVSYQAYAGTAGSHDISLPVAGWSLIGCPFLGEKAWENALVTRAGTTVSVRTDANGNGWLNPTAWWWDSDAQSLSDLSLPEFYPASESVVPWHGYWVQSNVNDVTLTVR